MHVKKTALSVAVAAVVALALAGSASAFTATVSPAGSYTATVRELTFAAGSGPVICSMTLAGTFASSIAEVERSGRTLGSVQRATIRSCNNEATVTPLGLPWPLTTTSVEGPLPDDATELNFAIAGFGINFSSFPFGVNCLFRGNAAELMPLTDTGTDTYSSSTFEEDGTRAIPLKEGFACASAMSMEGTLTLSSAQSLTIR